MTVNRTTLLDLPLPVTGTESGTWGDTTNNGLTQYVDIAIAGMSNLTSANFTAGALTIETTEGDSSATNISATSAQYAGFRVTSLAANSTITVGNTGTSPARSYRLINADATYSLTFKATGQTGVTLLPGQSALVAFNGTDYVIVGTVGAGSTTDNTVPRFDGTTGKILQSSGITIDDSNNVSGVAQLNITTLDATNIEVTNIKAKDGTAAASIADSTGVISVTANPILSGGTANGVLYLNGSKVATSGSALTFDGTTLATTGKFGITGSGSTPTASALQIGTNGVGSRWLYNVPTGGEHNFTENGTVLSWQNISTLGWLIGGSEQMRLTSTGLGIGTSSPSYKLHVVGGNATGFLLDNGGQQYTQLLIQRNGAANTGGDILVDGTNSTFSIRSLLAGPMIFSTSASAGVVTEKMRLDSSGNLGLGVTPSAWNTLDRGIELSLNTGQGFFAGLYPSIIANAYRNAAGDWIYRSSAPASRYAQVLGVHSWHNATSGTAGNAITFTQAMTLDASNNLLVGTTSAAAITGFSGSAVGQAIQSANPVLALVDSDDTTNYVTWLANSGGTGYLYTKGAYPFVFGTNGAERARITSGGDLLVGTTSATNSPTTGVQLVNGGAGGGVFIGHPNGVASGNYYATFVYNSGIVGSITQDGTTAVLFNTTSDQRLKENICDAEDAATLIDSIKVRQYDWKSDGSHQRYGFVAQELLTVAPEAVHQPADPDEMMAVDYSKLVPMLVKEIQSLRQRVALLEGN